MSRGAYEVAIRRIMVAMDSSTHSLWALEAAAALAGRLEAELLGVFVEDVRLLHLAGLPFSRELAGSSALARELSSSGMERALRVQAQRMRRELMTQAQRVQVQCSFRVLRGEVAGQLLEGVPGADLIILGKMGESPGARRRLGSIAHAVAMR
nr:universal stress protein [Gammaproteobacteria bacterium]NIX84325.1 universal stress protein [Gammaproteobacteria bacterium]